MSNSDLMHCTRHPRIHRLRGRTEVIESVEWALAQLGHVVSYALNTCDPTAANIVFDAQVLTVELLQKMHSATTVFNIEQRRGLQREAIHPELKSCAHAFRIRDCSASSLPGRDLLGAAATRLVQVGYAPILTRISKSEPQDIDSLIYGISGDMRLEAFHRLSRSGLKKLLRSGLHGPARDALIARAKLVLNVNLYDQGQIFEVVRASYLLANCKAVVATLDANTAI